MSKPSITTCMIDLIQLNKGPWELPIIAAELIITDTRYNQWCATVVKRTVKDPDVLMEFADPEPLDQSRAAVDRFIKDNDAIQLVKSLTDVNRRLKELMCTPLS